MKYKVLINLVVMSFLSGCYLSPGMYFFEGSKGSAVDGTTKMVKAGGLQYRLRIIPITKKLLYLQNASRKRLRAVASNTTRSVSGIFDTSYVYRVQSNDILGVTLWESTAAVSPVLSRMSSFNTGSIASIARGMGSGSGSGIGSGIGSGVESGMETGGQGVTNERSVTVDGEGYIYFPFAGEIDVRGLTPSQIRRKMQSAMKEYFDDPKISVRVLQHNSQFAIVTGQVVTPGRIPIVSKVITVIDAINASGGLVDKGAWKQATLSRANGQKIIIDLHRLYVGGNMAQNHVLRHGDVLHVPIIQGNTAYYYSDGSAKPLLLQNDTISLTEAIGNAGGLSASAANPREIFVLRRDEGRPFEEITAYHFNGRSPAALLLANSFYLKPKDIVYIETANLVRWGRVMSLLSPLSSTLSTASGVQNSVDNF